MIARTDARAQLGLDEAIKRANRYARAGADIIFVEAPQGPDEIERIAREVDAPLLINLVLEGLTPDGGPEYLQDLGYAIAIHPVDLFAAAAHAMIAALAELGGTQPAHVGRDPKSLFQLVGLTKWPPWATPSPPKTEARRTPPAAARPTGQQGDRPGWRKILALGKLTIHELPGLREPVTAPPILHHESAPSYGAEPTPARHERAWLDWPTLPTRA